MRCRLVADETHESNRIKAERESLQGACGENSDNRWEVWTEWNKDFFTGRRLSDGTTLPQALAKAHRVLAGDLRRVAKLRASEVRKRLKRK